MKIVEATFIKSAVKPEQYPNTPSLPEIALAGRSNVGKSSLLNSLLGRKGLAHVGQTPGKTRLLNFFRITTGPGVFRLVDLPGYGFAKVSKVMREEWGKSIDAYLNGRDELAAVCILVDSRHTPTPDDMTMVDWARGTGVPLIIAATKVDKLNKSELAKAQTEIRKTLALNEDEPLIFYSSSSGAGRLELLAAFASILEWD